ncbi:hypothetical protein FHS07_002338 [Microbacterium proteolyticum]|uniref:Alpha/beta hydrolase n=1 Tax=Microbacterium proteolyticum TaxID=1572644 RepID=A0A7W5CJ42_9MICO|nr:hypothetical protein [Microbacterium proteolyticum]MBB3158642.1 hypothetical protein [Microbacterium proteolyticum]
MTPALDDIPTCPADPAELRRLAASVAAAGSALRVSTEHVGFVWGLLPGVYRAPEAPELQQSMRLLSPAGAEIETGLRSVRAAIETLADDVEAVNLRRDALVDELRNLSATEILALPEPDDAFVGRLRNAAHADQATAFRRDCAALVEGWADAARACAAALRAIPDLSWTLTRDLVVDEAALETPSASILDDAAVPLLRRLARGGAADAARLLRENPEWAAIIRRGRPEAIAGWWTRISPSTAAGLITGVPALIGTLDGIALDDRVAANRSRAAAHLAELRAKRDRAVGIHPSPGARRSRALPSADIDAIDRETAYFQAVADGRKQLYAWDPRHGSLIEMSGNPSTAKAALFVVPGTNTTADSFYGDEPVTRFADWQVRSGREQVVAFTVMTGPMPQLSDIPFNGGPQWNQYAHQRAPEYAQFVQGVRAAEPSVRTMSYEHSYGGGVGSAAEAYGGIVDARFLAASVGAVDGYEPLDGTTYYSAQGPDDINRYYAGLQLGPLGFGEGPESFEGVRLVESGLPGINPANVALGVPLIVAESVEHHNALMSDDERVNGTVLNAVNQILNESKAHQ